MLSPKKLSDRKRLRINLGKKTLQRRKAILEAMGQAMSITPEGSVEVVFAKKPTKINNRKPALLKPVSVEDRARFLSMTKALARELEKGKLALDSDPHTGRYTTSLAEMIRKRRALSGSTFESSVQRTADRIRQKLLAVSVAAEHADE